MDNKEEAQDRLFEQACLLEQLSPNSLPEYVFRAARVRRLTGLPLGYEGLRRYFRLKAGLSVSTLRGAKSAVMFILRISGRPMDPVQASRLDDLLDGLECKKGVPEKVRGAPSATQISQLVAAAHRDLGAESACALVVAHGCGLRANELADLEVEDYDSVGEVVWVNRAREGDSPR